jgi:large subunit ribosomal protein L5
MDIKKRYKEKAIPEMKKKFNFQNDLEVPKIEKVVANVGIGKYLKDDNAVKEIQESFKMILGQKPVMTKSKKSIAGFKIREGLEIGIKATLRGKRMWDFINRLVGAAIPRTRDFHGLKDTAIDNGGNLNIGIKEHLIFPEILPEKVKNNFGIQITVVTNAGSREKGLELFKLLGFPLENKS